MTKYYRVRTQEQWDWLKQKLGSNTIGIDFIASPSEDILVTEYDQSISIIKVNKEDTSIGFIEVSNLMEDEKMEDYVTIKGEDVEKLKNEQGDSLFFMSDKQHFAYSFIEGFDCSEVNIPKSLLYPKVRMSVAEKAELDKLKNEMSAHIYDLDDLLTRIRASEYPHLYHRLYVADGDGVKSQLEFARAWADPSLIEVIPEKKWKVKVPRSDESYYFKDKIDGKAYLTTVSIEPKNNTNGALFTDEELKQFGLDNDLFEKVEVLE